MEQYSFSNHTKFIFNLQTLLSKDLKDKGKLIVERYQYSSMKSNKVFLK